MGMLDTHTKIYMKMDRLRNARDRHTRTDATLIIIILCSLK